MPRFEHPVCGVCGEPVISRRSRVNGVRWVHATRRAESRCGKPKGVCEALVYEESEKSVMSDLGSMVKDPA